MIKDLEPAAYEAYLAAIELFDVEPRRQGVPAVYIGDTHLVGGVEIPQQLDGLIQDHLDRGGVDYPPIPGLDALLAQTTPAEGALLTLPNVA